MKLMLIRRSSSYRFSNYFGYFLKCLCCKNKKKPQPTIKSVEINKQKLLKILQVIKELKESEEGRSLFLNHKRCGNVEIENLLLRMALMKVGFVPSKDNSVQKFRDTLYYYRSRNDVKEYIPYVVIPS
jgi:hypothetical protein